MATLAFLSAAHIHTPGFIKMIKARPEIQVKYVWDNQAARGKVRAAELNATFTKSLAKVLGDASVDGVVICSETNRHKKLVLAAAEARKAMFVEKPLGITGKDSHAMADAIEQAGVLFQTGYFNRSNAMFRFIREQIQQGNLGQVTRIRGSNCHNGAIGDWFRPRPEDPANDWHWMTQPKLSGGGAFGDLGTHLLDILMWMMGDVDAVTAQIHPVIHRYGDTDESGEAMIRFKNGCVGTLAAGWVDAANPVSLLVSGTEGHAAVVRGELYFMSKKIDGADGKTPWTQLPAPQKHAFELYLDRLIGLADAPLVPVREAAERVSVMTAMYEASKKQRWVRIG